MSPPRRDALVIFALLLAIAAVAYAAPLFGGATFVGRDHLTHTIPAKQHIADALATGHLPEWWDAVDLGVPFAANPNHSTLYPPTWLVAALPMPWSADLLLVLHVLLAGLGCAALARGLGAGVAGAVVAGAAFMLGGFVPSTLVHGGPLLTIAWIPWVAWAALRLADASERKQRLRRMLALAAFIGCELLAGDPSFAIVGGLLAFAIVACRAERRLPALAATIGAHVVGVLLAAVVILPAVFLAADSARAGGVAHDAAVAWSMHPLRVLEWFWPDALGDPNQETLHLARVVADSSYPLKLSPSWALSVYVSLPIVLLAIVGWWRGDRRVRWLAVVAAGFVVLALGRYTPIYDAYRTVFLPERFVRYPEKYFGGALVLVCAMAGVGWTAIMQRQVSRRTAIAMAASIGAFALLVAISVLAREPLARSIEVTVIEPPLDVTAALRNAGSYGITAVAVSLAMLGALYLARRRPWMLHLGACILVGHLIERSWKLLPTFDRDIIGRPPLILRPLAGTATHRLARPTQHKLRPYDSIQARARTLYEGAAANIATRFGVAYLVGYDQGHSNRFEVWRDSILVAGDRGLDLFGVDHVVVPADEADPAAVLATDAPYGPYALIKNTQHRPRAFVAPRWRWFHDDASLAAALFPTTTQDADPATLATAHLLGRTGADDAAATAGAELIPCALSSQRPEVVQLVCNSPAGGYAVLLDSWAPGWTATVDGTPATIERADALARAVRIPAGRHVIEYRYRTPGLRAGALVSLLALLAVVAGILLSRKRATSAGDPSSP